MPEVVSCPRCQRKSRVPDNLVGKQVKCPGCSAIFTAEVGAAPAPPKPRKKADEEGDTYEVVDERKKKRRRSDDDDDEGERVSDRPRPRRARDEDDDDEDDGRVTTRRSRYSRDDDDEDDDEDDRPRRRRRLTANWLQIHRGLTMVLASIVFQIILVVVLVIGMFALVGTTFAAMGQGMGPGGPGAGPGKAAGGAAALGAGIIVLGILAILGSLGALGLKIAGHVFCLPSPQAHGCKGLALATLILVGTNVGCLLLNWIITFASLGAHGLQAVANPVGFSAATNAAATGVNWIGALAGLGAFYVFLVYLRSLALATGYDGLARNIIMYIITTLASVPVLCLATCVGAFFIGMAGAAAARNQQAGGMGNPQAAVAGMGALGIVCVGIWLLAGLGMFIWYVVILVQTRGAVASQLRRA